MIKRLFVIGFIFVCTSVAWSILAGVTDTRTNAADHGLRQRVERVWGAPQVQQPPTATWVAEEEIQRSLPIRSSIIDVTLRLDPRQKGLLWYATYAVDFSASYTVSNNTGAARDVELALFFPASNAVFDDLQFEIEGKAWLAAPTPTNDGIVGHVRLEPDERVTLRVGYRSQGLDRWTYGFGAGVAEVRDFRMKVRTNFAAIDFPDGSISPATKERAGDGWVLGWEFRRLVSGINIAIVMPEKLQPGPLASQISMFAPVSLFFFIVVMLAIGIVKGVELHPMHFFFLSAAFFAFHLLFAYLADLVPIHAAFVIAAFTSLALVTSYLRLVFGARFAFFAAGTAQLVYFVLFSYAFFFKGLTGISIIIGAVATLFVLMQTMARVNWMQVFTPKSA